MDSQLPKVGIALPELPQATSSILGSARRITRAVSAAFQIVEVLLDGVDQLPVGRVHDLERDGEVELLPLVLELIGVLVVVGHVDGDDVVRIQ